MLRVLRYLTNEFNCNHEADIDSKDQVIIYNRELEHKKINAFLTSNIAKKNSGLMYLCGHPGTGKTSSLNSCLAQLREENNFKFKPILFNAMDFRDVKNFGIVLYQKLHETFFGSTPTALKRDLDDEELA